MKTVYKCKCCNMRVYWRETRDLHNISLVVANTAVCISLPQLCLSPRKKTDKDLDSAFFNRWGFYFTANFISLDTLEFVGFLLQYWGDISLWRVDEETSNNNGDYMKKITKSKKFKNDIVKCITPSLLYHFLYLIFF